MAETAKKPAIRFTGFSDAWEQRKVTELGEIYIGLVTTMTSHYTDHGALLIRISKMVDLSLVIILFILMMNLQNKMLQENTKLEM